MRIYCLSSFTKRDFESDMRQDRYDNYIPQLNGCEKYAYTEIFVGRQGPNFEFQIFREDFGILRYFMSRGLLEATREGNDYIDVEIGKNNGFDLQSFVQSIRLRCVKADSSRNITKEQKTYFNEYADKIEKYANEDPDRREAAFYVQEIEPFKLVTPDEDNNRMSDLMNAFNGLCHESTRRISSRYDQSADPNININLHKDNDHRINNIKDFTKTKKIKLYRSKLPKINPKWFNATNLDTLELSCVYPFDFDESGQWKIFGNGIRNCKNLRVLTFHDCGIEEIPDFVFEALPESLTNLNLGDNNIKRISPSIERLKNLYSFSVSYNSELSDDGFPWTCLPETLGMLDLAATSLTQIPAAIERLSKLEHLIVGKSVAYIKWKCLPQSLEELHIDADGKLNPPRSMQRLYHLQRLGLRNTGFKQRFFKHLPSTFWLSHVDLSNNNFRKFKCPNVAHQITRLYLNNCNLEKVEWADIWRCLPSLRRLELNNNKITEVKIFNFGDMELTHLDLENNKIKEINAKYLPDSLIYLNLFKNEISIFKNIELLFQLSYLWIDSNQLTELPTGIERCRSLSGITASKNNISKLPEGLENVEQMIFMDLSYNKFLPDDLDRCLWDRLPKDMGLLKISNNNLGHLPCQLSKRVIWKLEANDCNLKHICPRIGYSEYLPGHKNYLSVKQNAELECLSFVPTKIYSVPKVKGILKLEESEKGRLILSTDRSFRDTTRWHTRSKIHNYDFILKEDEEGEEMHKCQCCARCGEDCREQIGIIETYMVMDFTQIVETQDPQKGKVVIEEFGPGEWKTLIKTKMCKKCIDEIKLEVLMFYDDVPLEHKIRERDQEVCKVTESIVTTIPDQDGAAPDQPQIQHFEIPFPFNHISNMDVPEETFTRPQHQPVVNNSTQSAQPLIQYIEEDGSIVYGEPQQQSNYYEDVFVYQEGGQIDGFMHPQFQYYNTNADQTQLQTYSNQEHGPLPNTHTVYPPQGQQMPWQFDNSTVLNQQQYSNFPPNTETFNPQDVQMADISQNYVFTADMNDEEFNRNANQL